MAGDPAGDAADIAFALLLASVSWVYELPPVLAVLVLFSLFGLLATTVMLGVWVLLDWADQPPRGRHAVTRGCLHVDSLCPTMAQSTHARRQHPAHRPGRRHVVRAGRVPGPHPGRTGLRGPL